MAYSGGYLKISTDDEVKDFVVITLGEYFKPVKEKLHSKLNKEQNLENLLNHFISFLQHLMK